jgi:PTS system galactitol-specific IIC component
LIGIAFIGINLVIGLMWTTLTQVGQAMVTNTGLQRSVIDVGWPAAAAIAFATRVGLWVIPFAIVVNLILLFARFTKTLNIDLWNFWHFAFIGSMVAIIRTFPWGWWQPCGSRLGLFFGDWTAKAIQGFTTCLASPSSTDTAPGVPFAVGVNWVLERSWRE